MLFLVLLVVIIVLVVWTSSQNKQKERAATRAYAQAQDERRESFDTAPVINSHRVPCPDCDDWSTLLVNARGAQKRVCDTCGETFL